MKAAAVSRSAATEVTLVEREDALGGQVNLILRTPGRDEFGWITRDLEVQMHRHGVDVRLGTEATPSSSASSRRTPSSSRPERCHRARASRA